MPLRDLECMCDGVSERLERERKQRAFEVVKLIEGFHPPKNGRINLRKIYAELSGEKYRAVDLDDPATQEILAESHARVPPEIRKRQLEMIAAAERAASEEPA